MAVYMYTLFQNTGVQNYSLQELANPLFRKDYAGENCRIQEHIMMVCKLLLLIIQLGIMAELYVRPLRCTIVNVEFCWSAL